MTSRQIACSAAAISVFAIALGALAPSPAAAQQSTIGVNAFPNAKALPLHAGIAKGIFARRGLRLDLELTEGATAQRQGFAAGKFQIVHSAIDNAVYNIEAVKLDNVILSGGDQGMNEFFVQADIKSFADLRGRVLVVDAPDTAYALQLKKILAQHGIKEGDYTIKPVGAGVLRLKAMLEDKTNAGGILNLPFTVQAEAAGMKSLGRTIDMLGAYQAAGAFTMRKWAEANRDTLARYLAAYVESLRFVRDPANKAANLAILVDKLKLSTREAERTYALLIDPAFGFAPDARFDLEGFRNVLALRAEIEGGRPAPPERYIDLGYHERALARLGR